MGKIHQLSTVLSNQIAAGEVVERPASVVKELVENAIDANSQAIDVVVDDAGFSKIQVIDDGQGIDPDDVPTAFLRHATSKITDRMDLFKVRSLGFRGEALPSIASVSDITLTTSTGKEGLSFHVKGGHLVDQKPAELRRGTNVVVKDLFYNTPARLKYMKSPSTELAKITDILDRLALGHPKIAFSLTHNGRELIRTSGRGNLQQVMGSIYGATKVKKMLLLHGRNDDFQINGLISLPELTRASRNYLSLIINGRYVKNYELSQALVAGYGSKLMVGRYPIAVIDIKMDPMLVDANVHPTKQTVRISKEEELCNLITELVAKQLGRQNLIPNAIERQGAVQPKYLDSGLDLNWQSQSATSTKHFASQPRSTSDETNSNGSLIKAPTNFDNSEIIIKQQADLTKPAMVSFDQFYQASQNHPFPFDQMTNDEKPVDDKQSEITSVRPFPHLIYIGQMHGTYLLAESDDGMYIVDQHAAQERINYEQLRESIGEVSDDQQNLLVPIVLEYSNADYIQINAQLDTLAAIGIHLEPFGKNSFIIHQHPSWFVAGEEERTIREMIDWVLKHRQIAVKDFRAKTAIMMSCKRAIKANHHLNREQAEQLLENLARTEDPFNCPHGRPVLVHFSNYDMQRMFRRIQDNHRSLKNGQGED